MRTQPGRFRIQKTVYLLRHTGYPPAQSYSFGLYHMGPYSSELAAAYYALNDEGLREASSQPARDIPEPTRLILREALQRSNPFLEGLTTFLDVRGACRDEGAAWRQARSIKPHLTPEVWEEVRGFLTAHPGLIKPI